MYFEMNLFGRANEVECCSMCLRVSAYDDNIYIHMAVILTVHKLKESTFHLWSTIIHVCIAITMGYSYVIIFLQSIVSSISIVTSPRRNGIVLAFNVRF